MASNRPNPMKLNALQLKTLVILQAVARDDRFAGPDDEEDGARALHALPHAHGDHFHVGRAVVSGRDATGLSNPNVMNALARKGLVRAGRGGVPVVTAGGLAYETGIESQILHAPDH